MKQFALCTALLGCWVHAFAQTPPTTQLEHRKQQHQLLTSRLLHAQTGMGQALKPTGIQHRVIAQAIKDINDPPDSVAYSYTANRGSRFDYNSLFPVYPIELEHVYAPIPLIPTGLDGQGIIFSADPGNLLADSILFYRMGALDFSQACVYNTGNRIQRSDINSATVNLRFLSHYDNLGHLLKTYRLESTGGSDYDTTAIRSFAYNSSFTRLEADTIYQNGGSGPFIPFNTFRYHYQASGRLDSVIISTMTFTLAPRQKLTFDYYPDGKLRKVVNRDNTLPDVMMLAIDTFGYTAGSDYATYAQGTFAAMMADDTLIDGLRQVRYPGAGGLPDSTLLFSYEETIDSWLPDDKMVFYYTSFSAPDSIARYWDDGEFKSGTKFYYESYEGTLSVPGYKPDQDLSIYPNPFDRELHIDVKLSGAVLTRLLTVTGQEVYRQVLDKGDNTLQLPTLSKGLYILLLQDSNGGIRSHKIQKQ